ARSAFWFPDALAMGSAEAAEAIGREPAAGRKLASRARGHVRAARPRFTLPRERGLEIARAFFAASRQGDLDTLRSLRAEDVVACSGGGGRVAAAPRPRAGIGDGLARHGQLARALAPAPQPLTGVDDGLARHAEPAAELAAAPSVLVRYARIDGLPGFSTVGRGGIVQTTALQTEEERVVGIFVVRNPEKVRHLKQ